MKQGLDKVRISEIITDSGTQSRCIITEDVVADYAERMAAGDEFPPIVVFNDGSQNFLADGFHRVMAAMRNGSKSINSEIRKGTKLDAIKFSIGANVANGLRRTNSDKRRCVTLALENWANKSDRLISEMCGVGHDLVSEMRRELEALAESANDRKTRTTKDGRQYPSVRKPATPKSKTLDEQWVEAAGSPVKWEQGSAQISTPADEAPEDNETDTLWSLKRCWKKATKKEKAEFLKWIEEPGNK